MNQQCSFKITIQLPLSIEFKIESGTSDIISKSPYFLNSNKLDRESFYAFVWESFGEAQGLVGISEGTMLAEEAFEEGLETESFTIDSALAPRERDWLAGKNIEEAVLYFVTSHQAKSAREFFIQSTDLVVTEVEEQVQEDWDAQWKASFMGIDLPPYWKIVPPWNLDADYEISKNQAFQRLKDQKLISLVVNPGAGFGTGTHETTQLCLTAIANEFLKRDRLGKKIDRVFDFGSGSGILAIGATLLGAESMGVEIDTLANDNARENARLNDVSERVQFFEITPTGLDLFPLVVANILRPVLLEFADILCGHLDATGTLVLSGLVENDIPFILDRFTALLPKSRSEVFAKGDWRCVVFSLVSA